MTGEDHWGRATAGLPTPLVAVDLDALDANADDLVRRAGGLPVRVASKSVRCRALLARVLGRPGFARRHGVCRAGGRVAGEGGCRDIFVAYPSVDVPALREVASDDLLRAEVTVTIDRSSTCAGSVTCSVPASSAWGWPSTWTPRCASPGCTSGSGGPRPARRPRHSPSYAPRRGSGWTCVA